MGIRERKAARTREEISRVAIRLFSARGFDAVTMTDVAEAADVGRATLFAYFPTKDRLVLDRIRDDNPCQAFIDRAPGASLADAMRAYFRGLAAQFGPAEVDGTKLIIGLVVSTPTLMDGLSRIFDHQREELAALLVADQGGDPDDLTAHLVAAQTIGINLTLKSRFYERLVAGEAAAVASKGLADEADVAFGLLEAGIGNRYRKGTRA